MVSFLIQFRYFIYLAPTVIFRPICVGPCRHIVARPRVTDAGDGLQIRKVTGNILYILYKQSQIADKCGPPA